MPKMFVGMRVHYTAGSVLDKPGFGTITAMRRGTRRIGEHVFPDFCGPWKSFDVAFDDGRHWRDVAFAEPRGWDCPYDDGELTPRVAFVSICQGRFSVAKDAPPAPPEHGELIAEARRIEFGSIDPLHLAP